MLDLKYAEICKILTILIPHESEKPGPSKRDQWEYNNLKNAIQKLERYGAHLRHEERKKPTQYTNVTLGENYSE